MSVTCAARWMTTTRPEEKSMTKFEIKHHIKFTSTFSAASNLPSCSTLDDNSDTWALDDSYTQTTWEKVMTKFEMNIILYLNLHYPPPLLLPFSSRLRHQDKRIRHNSLISLTHAKRSPRPFRKSQEMICVRIHIFQIFIFNTPKSYLSTSIINDSGSISATSIIRHSHCLDYHGKIIDTVDSWSSKNSNLLISWFIIIIKLYKTINYFFKLF